MASKGTEISKKKENIICGNDNPNQHSNLNLNPNYRCSKAMSSKSVTIKSNNETFKMMSNVKDINAKLKKYSNTWKKSYKEFSPNSLNVSLDHGEKEFSPSMDQSITSNSTLSLHITAYENALEAVNVEKNGNKITTKVIKKWEYGKQVPTASTTDIQNPFEFPRQQENQAIRPEVMEYRADQGLLNPNDRGNYKKYTPQQKTDCVIWYIESWSPTSVQRSFHAKYGRNVPVPDARTIKQWFERFQQRGTVYRIERVSNRPVRTNVNVQEVLEYFSAFQHSSLRRAENELGIPKSTIHLILKAEKWHPYVMQYVQELFPNDLLLRVNFAEEHLAFLSAQPDHLERIWWSDEANFHVCGGVNKEDFRYWSPINPLFHSAKPLHSPKVTVWAALNANGIVGPYFFPGTVGAQSYCQMLEEVFIPEIQNRPDFDTMLFQQDGAPPHFALQTRALLDEVFPERWIGRASPNLNWPPRSPDLTPLDFFCWGYIKSKVYAVPIRDVEHLKERIVDAFIDLTPEMVRRACLSGVEHRLRKCIEVNGQSVELPNEPHPIPVQPAPPVPQNPPPNRRRRRVSPLRNVEHQPPRRRGRPSNQTSAASNASVRQVQHATNVVQDIPPPIDPPVGAELEDEPDVPPRFDENAEGPPRRDNFCVLT